MRCFSLLLLLRQTEAGAKLSSLEARWAELISRVLQVEVANIAAEAECANLRTQQEALERRLLEMDAEETKV